MLNYLVDKAINKPKNQTDDAQPIFTISYMSRSDEKSAQIKKNFQQKSLNQRSNSKELSKNNIFQKWKSKTLEKLKKLQPAINSQHTPSHLKQFKIKKSPCNLLKSKGSKVEDIQTVENMTNLSQELEQSTNEAKSKKENEAIAPKCVYILYKDVKGSPNQNSPPFIKGLHQRKLLHSRNSKNSSLVRTIQSFKESPQRDQKKRHSLSFFNTIQYRSVPKDEIRHYKAEQNEQGKRNIQKNQQHFKRSNEFHSQKVIPQDCAMMNKTTQNFNFPKQFNPESVLFSPTRKIRTVYTGKKSKRQINDSLNINQTLKIDEENLNNSYRPWSPIKTFPPFPFNDQEILEQQSKTLNLFDKIREFPYDNQ